MAQQDETQKQLLTEVMNADAKDGVYESNKMVSAVEWLAEKIYLEGLDDEFVKQAKQMEKEQVVKTYNDAIKKMDYFIQPQSAEQYYNETYGIK